MKLAPLTSTIEVAWTAFSHLCSDRRPGTHNKKLHYYDVIMGTMASQITSLTIVFSTVYSDADQRKHQSSASLAFMRGIHRSPHKWPVTRKMFPFDDVIMCLLVCVHFECCSSCQYLALYVAHNDLYVVSKHLDLNRNFIILKLVDYWPQDCNTIIFRTPELLSLCCTHGPWLLSWLECDTTAVFKLGCDSRYPGSIPGGGNMCQRISSPYQVDQSLGWDVRSEVGCAWIVTGQVKDPMAP